VIARKLVYPGTRSYPLDERVTVRPLSDCVHFAPGWRWFPPAAGGFVKPRLISPGERGLFREEPTPQGVYQPALNPPAVARMALPRGRPGY